MGLSDPRSIDRDRRRRILDATLTLASKGGYDAVQMRAVAEKAEVALGTLYRYFPSKIHLLTRSASRLAVFRVLFQLPRDPSGLVILAYQYFEASYFLRWYDTPTFLLARSTPADPAGLRTACRLWK